MERFYFSLGVKYEAGGHPKLSTTSRQLLVVEAVDEDAARAVMLEAVGRDWAFCYDEHRARTKIAARYFSPIVVPLDEALVSE